MKKKRKREEKKTKNAKNGLLEDARLRPQHGAPRREVAFEASASPRECNKQLIRIISQYKRVLLSWKVAHPRPSLPSRHQKEYIFMTVVRRNTYQLEGQQLSGLAVRRLCWCVEPPRAAERPSAAVVVAGIKPFLIQYV